MKNAGHLLNIYTDGGLGHEPRPPPSAPPYCLLHWPWSTARRGLQNTKVSPGRIWSSRKPYRSGGSECH